MSEPTSVTSNLETSLLEWVRSNTWADLGDAFRAGWEAALSSDDARAVITRKPHPEIDRLRGLLQDIAETSLEVHERVRRHARSGLSGDSSAPETCSHPASTRVQAWKCDQCGHLRESFFQDCRHGHAAKNHTCGPECSPVETSTDPNPLDPANHHFRKCLKGHVSYSASFPECPSCKVERERAENGSGESTK